MKKIVAIVNMIAIIANCASAAWAGELPENLSCPTYLSTKGVQDYWLARTVPKVDGKRQFTAESAKFLKYTRNNFRAMQSGLGGKFVELDYTVKRIMLAAMMRTHVFNYGDPGAAKSAIAREILGTKLHQPSADGSKIEEHSDLYSMQMNPLLGDKVIRGYMDPETGEVVMKNSLAVKKYGLIDEIDKSSPLPIAGILDIANEKIVQFGTVTKDARTETIVATSNMNVYEFLESFKMQGAESTARAVLDRFPFKVYSHNYPTSKAARMSAAKSGIESRAQKAGNILDNPSQAMNKNVDASPYQEVDFTWLGNLIDDSPGMFKFNDDFLQTVDDLTDSMRNKFNQMRKASEELSSQAAQDGFQRPVYYPPTIFSMRNYKEYTYKVVAASILYDLLTLPESVLSDEQLIAILQRGISIDKISAWRVQDMWLTGGPGDGALSIVKGKDDFDINYGLQINELLKNPFDIRQQVTLESINEERSAFKTKYLELIDSKKMQAKDFSDIISRLNLSSKDTKPVNIEELLIFGHQRIVTGK